MPSAQRSKVGIQPETAKNAPLYPQSNEPVNDLEFSDFGRDPRYPPSWWLLPLLAVGSITAVFLIVRFIL